MSALRSSLAEILSFTVIGAAGFVVDTAVLYGALALGLGLYAGRGVSYLAAVTFTWTLNSHYTFRSSTVASNRFKQWRRYATSQLSGAVLNLGVYAAVVRSSGYVAAHPVIGVGIGSLMGLMANYVAARRFVFQKANDGSKDLI